MQNETANQRLKRRFDRWLWGGVMGAAILHFALFRYFPELTAEDFSTDMTWIEDFIAPPDIRIPPPPDEIPRPRIPVVNPVGVDDDVTMEKTTWIDNPLPPPPPPQGARILDRPSFSPLTINPRLKDEARAARIVERHYPGLLKQAGIGGRVIVEALVDTTGRVISASVLESSGIREMDAAAVAAVLELEYTPGFNRDKKLRVKITTEISFGVR